MVRLLSALILFAALPIQAAQYFVDYNGGSDTNNGTSTNTAWKLSPGMNGFAGTYVHAAGDRIIFKGGVTWPVAALSFIIENNGTSGNRDYYGVQSDWYTGTSWSRPIINQGGTAITDARTHRNNTVYVKGDYVTFDGFEITGTRVAGNAQGNYTGICLWNGHSAIITNCYVHDWVVLTVNEGDVGGICDSPSTLASTNEMAINNTVRGPIVDPAYRTDPNGTDHGAGVYGFTFVAGNTISRTVQAIHDGRYITNNIILDGGDCYDSSAHENAIWLDQSGWMANNLISNWVEGVTIYLIPEWDGTSRTQYCYNNIVLSSGPTPIQISDTGVVPGNTGQVYIWNNTLEKSGTCIRDTQPTATPFYLIDIRNNLFISSAADPTSVPAGTYVTLIESNNVIMSAGFAAAVNMNPGNLYTPQVATAPVGAGVDLSAFFTTDYNGRTRTIPWDSAAIALGSTPIPPAPPVIPPTPGGLTITSGRITSFTSIP